MVNIESVFLHSPDNGFWECLGDIPPDMALWVQRQTGATDVGRLYFILFKEMCRMFGVTQKFSSLSHAKTSGAVKRANTSLLTVLRNYTSTPQDDWDQFLPSACFL